MKNKGENAKIVNIIMVMKNKKHFTYWQGLYIRVLLHKSNKFQFVYKKEEVTWKTNY